MKIYLDFAFLEGFFLSNDDSYRHSKLKELLCDNKSPARLITNFDFEEIYEDPEKKVIFKQITERIPEFDLSIIDKANTVSFHETKEPSLFFMNAESLRVERFGCFSMTSNQLEKADLLIYSEKPRVDTPKSSWSFLSSYKLPCNSLILTDNYLFSNDTTYENIFAILKSLMPSNLEIAFDLIIIGDNAKNFKPIKEQSDKLMTELKKGFQYTINLTIIRADHHARLIHTNYTRFGCEKGFGLFKNRRITENNETTIEFSSICEFGRVTSTYETRNDELKKCEEIIRPARISDRLIGLRKNRLIT